MLDTNYKRNAFYAGEAFHRAALTLIPDDWLDCEDGYWFVPATVNMAFACELYLKSLLSTGTENIRGHKLHELFERLPEKKKQDILRSPEFNGDDTFEDSLQFNSTIFEDWRYHFEANKHAQVDMIFLERFSLVLNQQAEADLSAESYLSNDA